MPQQYSNAELERVRAVITGAGPWPESGNPAGADADAALHRKLTADPLVAAYSLYAFFPGIYPRLYHQGERPTITYDGRTRGQVAILKFNDGAGNSDGIVVKPLQSRREAAIARIAGDSGIGPRQFPTLDGFLVEEWVAGPFFTDLPADAITEAGMYAIGRQLGKMLSNLHARQIYYNDATLSDPAGRSHLIVRGYGGPESGTEPGPESGAEPDCRLIDFGVSVLLDNFPHLEPEAVYNLVRTTPEFRLLSRMGLADAEMGQFLAQYRQRLAAVSPEEILARDLRFTEEGLRQAAQLLGRGHHPAFPGRFPGRLRLNHTPIPSS